jgi:hypothetical protein
MDIFFAEQDSAHEARISCGSLRAGREVLEYGLIDPELAWGEMTRSLIRPSTD